ncbi:MAG: polymer-forming cytoskeletal protein [Desulfobacterales bacterium]|nr:polymer-forming cytoskeletal protein [Desulfobacterales bacterium]
MAKSKEEFSVLDKGLSVEGTISFKGKIIIRGSLKGILVGETVVISEEGAVYADIKAASITVGGIFEGKIRALTELIILATGKCEGNIICKNLVVEPGGILNGSVTRITSDNSIPNTPRTALIQKSPTVEKDKDKQKDKDNKEDIKNPE